MITKAQRKNAERINALAQELGHLPFNAHGQTTNEVLNLSIPCAHLIVAGVVTGVDKETYDGVHDESVREVEHHVRLAVELATERHGSGWWTEAAERLLK
jgi:hypothetical protein